MNLQAMFVMATIGSHLYLHSIITCTCIPVPAFHYNMAFSHPALSRRPTTAAPKWVSPWRRVCYTRRSDIHLTINKIQDRDLLWCVIVDREVMQPSDINNITIKLAR